MMGEQKPNNDKLDSSNGRPECVPLSEPTKLEQNPAVNDIRNTKGSDYEPNPPVVMRRIFGNLKRFWDAVRKPENTNTVVAIATVVIAGMAFLQWWEMRNAGTQTDRIIAADERLATAMEGSVKQAKEFVDATIKQSQLDQRAWVAPSEVSGNPEVGKPWLVTITFRNTGKTIARNVRVTNASDQVPNNRQPDFKPIGSPTGRGILSPASVAVSQIKISGGLPLPKEIFDRYEVGQVRLFVYGQVIYDDIFGKSHSTIYCSVYDPRTIGFISCPNHNDAN